MIKGEPHARARDNRDVGLAVNLRRMGTGSPEELAERAERAAGTRLRKRMKRRAKPSVERHSQALMCCGPGVRGGE